MNTSLTHIGVNLLAAAPPAVTLDSMNEVFSSSVDVLTTNAGATTSAGGSVLLGIAIIEFILFLYGAYLAKEMTQVAHEAIKKAFFIFIVAMAFYNWGALANWTKGYIVGGAASAGGASSMVQTLDPAYVASEGFDKVAVIFNAEAQAKMAKGLFGTDAAAEKRRARQEREAKLRANQSAFDSFVNTAEGYSPSAMVDALSETGEQFALQLFALLLFGTLGILIVCVYIYCAAMMFVISIEFYIVVVMTKLLVPFALNKHTSGLASAALNAVVAKSVQLGVLVLVLSMFGKSLSGLALGPSPTLYEVLALLGTSAFMAFAISRVPAIAASIFAGAGSGMDIGGSLIAGAAAAGAAAANIAAPVAGKGVEMAAKGATSGAKAGVNATAAAASAVGQTAAGAAGKMLSSVSSGQGGGSKMGQMLAGRRDASGFGAAQKRLDKAEGKLDAVAGKKTSPKKAAQAVQNAPQARDTVDAIKSTPQGRLDAARAEFTRLAGSQNASPEQLYAAMEEVGAAEAAVDAQQVAESRQAVLSESNADTARAAGDVISVSQGGNVDGPDGSGPEPDDSAAQAPGYAAPGEQPQGFAAVGQGAGVLPAVTGPEAIDNAQTVSTDAVVTQQVPHVPTSGANDWATAPPDGGGGASDDGEDV